MSYKKTDLNRCNLTAGDLIEMLKLIPSDTEIVTFDEDGVLVKIPKPNFEFFEDDQRLKIVPCDFLWHCKENKTFQIGCD